MYLKSQLTYGLTGRLPEDYHLNLRKFFHHQLDAPHHFWAIKPVSPLNSFTIIKQSKLCMGGEDIVTSERQIREASSEILS